MDINKTDIIRRSVNLINKYMIKDVTAFREV